MTRHGKRTTTYRGFPVPLEPDTVLGLAMLIAEDGEGHYEPIGVAATISEATEIAEHDLQARRRRLEHGEDSGLCPCIYKLWALGVEGAYILAEEIQP